MRDSITFLPAFTGKNQRSHQFLNWWQRYATGISHLIGSNPIPNPMLKNPRPRKRSGIFWQRMRDSNPRKRSQSPVCYRYTNPLNGTFLIIRKWAKKSRVFWPICKFISFLLPIPTEKASQTAHFRANSGMLRPLPHPAAWSKYRSVPAGFGDGSALFHGF